jgi:outer membrane protein
MQRLILSLLFSSAWAGQVLAQSSDGRDRDPIDIRLGAALATMPEYSGSADQMVRVLPLVSFDNIAGFEFSGLALTYPLIDIGPGQGPDGWSVKAGPRAGFDFGRDSSDSPTLTGFEDIDASVLLGGYVRATYGVLGVRVDAGQDVIGGHDGFIADISVGTYIPPGLIAENLALQPALTLSWANANHNQTVYGVTPTQAAASGLAVDDIDAGFHRASANLLGWYDLDERWQVFSILSYREYLGEVRDSPILRAPDGATSDVFGMLGLSYKFSL